MEKNRNLLVMLFTFVLMIIVSMTLPQGEVRAQDEGKSSNSEPSVKNEKPKQVNAGRKPKSKNRPKRQRRRVRNEQFSTTFDFEESVLQGKMKQPAQVLLKGRRETSKGQIIELRKNFRNELRSSAPGALRHSR